jgi:adenylate cyclase
MAEMAEDRVDRRLAAIFAGDIAGYSRLMGVDEEGTLRQLKAHRKELVDPKITEHRGRIVKTTGDGMLVEFVSVVDAVRCGVDIQRGMAERNSGLPADNRIEFRIGINVGDIISDSNDIYGDGVNVAARLEALADPGGIMVSRAVHDQVRDKLSFGFKDMGEQPVKNIARKSKSRALLVRRSPYCRSPISVATPSRNTSPTAFLRTSSQDCRSCDGSSSSRAIRHSPTKARRSM